MSRPVAQSMRSVSQSATEATSAINRASSASQRMASARERLGIRSEQSIQREIHATEAAYNRLARAGSVSAREQARAFEASRRQIAELRRELNRLPQQPNLLRQGYSMGRTGLNAYSAVAGGAMAGVMVAEAPIKRTMEYDRRLAMMSNTAYADQSLAGRKVGMAELDEAIKRAVRYGGGKRDEAADTLDSLISSGALGEGEAGRKSAIGMLPTLQRYGTATNTDPQLLGQIAVRAKQTMDIADKDLPLALDMAIKAGQEGGFELKDMARWLPQQMAAAKQAGMSGLPGFAKLLAANQASVITAGSKDEAGNNLVNLLAKINSQDTAVDAKKIKIDGKSIDLAGSLAAAREKGVNPLDAFANLVDKVVSQDKRYVAAKAKAETATGDEKKAALNDVGNLLEGSAIGKLIQDRQALMALVGYMGNRQYVRNIEAKLPTAGGTGDQNFQMIENTSSHQMERSANEKAFAEQDAMSGFNRVLGDTAGKLADYAEKYPGLGASLVGATTMLNVLAASAGAASLVQLMKGGGAADMAGRAMTAGSGSLLLQSLKVAGALGVAATAGYALGTGINWLINKAMAMATGDEDATWGGKMHDWINRTSVEQGAAPITLADINKYRIEQGREPLAAMPTGGSPAARQAVQQDAKRELGRLGVAPAGVVVVPPAASPKAAVVRAIPGTPIPKALPARERGAFPAPSMSLRQGKSPLVAPDPFASLNRQAGRAEQLSQAMPPIVLNSTLKLDGREIANSVNRINAQEMKRH